VFAAVRWSGDRKRTAAGTKRDRKRTAACREWMSDIHGCGRELSDGRPRGRGPAGYHGFAILSALRIARVAGERLSVMKWMPGTPSRSSSAHCSVA
jgi:hypothetical protein